MTKALTITPKISSSNIAGKARKTTAAIQNTVAQVNIEKKSKATRGLVGGIIDIFKAIIKKISNPEAAVSKIAKNINSPSHKDPAAIVMKSING